MPVGDAGFCSNLTGRIPADIRPGTPIMALSDLTYTEFCNGATGTDRTMCHNWEQATLSIRASTTLTTGVAVNTPSPTSATVPELGTMNAFQPGTRSLNLEGGLVEVSNAFVHVVMTDSGFPDYYLTDAVGSANEVLIETQNAFSATCIRNYLVAHDGMMIPSLRGPLEPSFGQWTIRLSGPSDIGGLDCSRDGGTGVDAGD
jgi:hypothetical protein